MDYELSPRELGRVNFGNFGKLLFSIKVQFLFNSYSWKFTFQKDSFEIKKHF